MPPCVLHLKTGSVCCNCLRQVPAAGLLVVTDSAAPKTRPLSSMMVCTLRCRNTEHCAYLHKGPESVLALVSFIPPGQLQLVAPTAGTRKECIKLTCSSKVHKRKHKRSIATRPGTLEKRPRLSCMRHTQTLWQPCLIWAHATRAHLLLQYSMLRCCCDTHSTLPYPSMIHYHSPCCFAISLFFFSSTTSSHAWWVAASSDSYRASVDTLTS